MLYYKRHTYDDITPINVGKFPCGELIADKFPSVVPFVILKWESDADLIQLMLLSKHTKIFELTILYMPYSRMDRDSWGGSKCSLRYIAEFIKSLGIEKIKVIDPHSDLTLAYLGDSAYSEYPFTELPGEYDVIIFPDAGAQKRYGKMELFSSLPQGVGFKTRNFSTGKITSYQVVCPIEVTNKKVLIVDDLCSYGGTFVSCAEALKNIDPTVQVDLMVSHCEDSIFKGKIPSGNYIHTVYTTDSLISLTEDFAWLKVIKHFTKSL